MLSRELILGVTFAYLALLFALAWYAERRGSLGQKIASHPWIYALSLAVYCTAWTFYGSVGRAASNGMEFMAIYVGPCLIAPLWWVVMRKIIRISKVMNISSIADFISSRYGKSANLGAMVTIFCLLGILPYISIQLQAITNSFEVLHLSSGEAMSQDIALLSDPGFYLALGLAGFTILFGTRDIDATSRHDGLVLAVAFESVFKLVAFFAIGIFVSFFLFDGLPALFSQASESGLSHLFAVTEGTGASDWFWIGILSMMAVLFLPRQFQMGVMENTSEKHLDTAMWLFPLYLLLINVFVLPIALAGLMIFENQPVNADTYVLAIPSEYGRDGLAILGYLGGFAAATSMIIVSAISLSTMVSTNLLMPLLVANTSFQQRFQTRLPKILIWGRRFTILGIILLAYFYFRILGNLQALVSTGLISFVAIAQLAPSILGGIFWKQGSKAGAIWGLLTGMAIWVFTLIVPTFIEAGYLSRTILSDGLFGISWLRPTSLLGMTGLSPVSHALIFSLFPNVFLYILISLTVRQSSREHIQAILFVDIFNQGKNPESAVVWKGQASAPDLNALLENFLGKKKAKKALQAFAHSTGIDPDSERYAGSEFVTYSQRLLAGVIGAASARILVDSVVKAEEIGLDELLDILKETQEIKSLNLELKSKSEALKRASDRLSEANEALKLNDLLKDEFISTVTHEMKTPITSIRAFSEILLDENLDEVDKRRFLQIIIDETGRMTRLIDQVLDLERFDSGKQTLNLLKTDIAYLIQDTGESMRQVFGEKNLRFSMHFDLKGLELSVDTDRIRQVILNLLSNALKFATNEVVLIASLEANGLVLKVKDDGPGIPDQEMPYIFDKFYQAKNQTSKKPIGSGLGLAISKKIIDYHGGTIRLTREDGMTTFAVFLPRQVTDSLNLTVLMTDE